MLSIPNLSVLVFRPMDTFLSSMRTPACDTGTRLTRQLYIPSLTRLIFTGTPYGASIIGPRKKATSESST